MKKCAEGPNSGRSQLPQRLHCVGTERLGDPFEIVAAALDVLVVEVDHEIAARHPMFAVGPKPGRHVNFFSR